jgi:HAD superfamily hydrolase (TIGR01509 family)
VHSGKSGNQVNLRFTRFIVTGESRTAFLALEVFLRNRAGEERSAHSRQLQFPGNPARSRLSIRNLRVRIFALGMSAHKRGSDLPAFLFDLDGTLIDSVYEHVQAWSKALSTVDIVLPKWKLHRRIGMSGQSFLHELLREKGLGRLRPSDIEGLERRHAAEFSKSIPNLKPLPGARDLLKHLASIGARWAIATTGKAKQTTRLLQLLNIPRGVPVITGDDVDKAKPSPDVFVSAAQRLGVSIEDAIVIGDSVWDLLAAVRKRALGVGLLSGGSGKEELQVAGAFRVYDDPADLLIHIEQLGVPGPHSRPPM